MVTEIDLQALKERIKAIIKANSTLWVEGNETGFVDVIIGMPDYGVFEGEKYPILYITNDDNLETDKPFGPITSNVAGSSDHTLNIKLIIYDKQQDAVEIEKQLDILYKTVKEVLKGNVALKHPTDNNDPKCTWSWPIIGKSFSAQFRGNLLDGRVITLQCKIHTS